MRPSATECYRKCDLQTGQHLEDAMLTCSRASGDSPPVKCIRFYEGDHLNCQPDAHSHTFAQPNKQLEGRNGRCHSDDVRRMLGLFIAERRQWLSSGTVTVSPTDCIIEYFTSSTTNRITNCIIDRIISRVSAKQPQHRMHCHQGLDQTEG